MSLLELVKKIIHIMTEAELDFRAQNHFKGYRNADLINRLLQRFLTDFQELECEELLTEYLSLLELALDALEQQDSIQLADVYEEGFMPLLMQTQMILFELEENPLSDQWGKNRRLVKQKDSELYRSILEARDDIPDEYQLCWAKTGDLVLKKMVGEHWVALNSSYNPWKEAGIYRRRFFDRDKRRYIVFGFGLGYHVEHLLREKGIKEVVVVEHDIRQLAVALSYRDLSQLLQDERLKIVHTSDEKEYLDYLSKANQDTQYCIWYPSVQTIEKESLRKILEDYWIEASSTENMIQLLQNNFEENRKKSDKEVTVLKEKFYGKTVIIVAAGPSLDDNIHELRIRNREETVLICVAKVAAKIIDAGVEPDYIIMSEGMPGARWQTKGIEDCQIPFIYISTLAANIVDEYNGPRYIVYQQGFEPATTYAGEQGITLYQSGGSVSTLALDIGIRMGCKKIICVGLDLGYPNEQTHGQGVGRKIADVSQLRKVEGIYSEYVYTNKPMDIYRKWIERRIKGEKTIEFINASQGARIHGMKEMGLKDCL